MNTNKLIMLFIDGIGLGKDDEHNPLLSSTAPLFSSLTGGRKLSAEECPFKFDGGCVNAVDACLGVEGLPQSATGQTAIFTGVNAPKLIGKHQSAFPTGRLMQVIEEKSVLKQLAERGKKVSCANLYSKEFFESREKSKRSLFPVSTLSVKAAGAEFRFYSAYAEDKAVAADISNEFLIKRGKNIPPSEPESAAQRMFNAATENDFIFFEYFMTDTHGHNRDKAELYKSIDTLNRFTQRLYELCRKAATDILIISDHGNAEDISTATHTDNKVPGIFLSEDPGKVDNFYQSVSSLTDVTPFILGLF